MTTTKKRRREEETVTGAKLTNIYSKSFTVETADRKSGLKFKMTWQNNMSKKGKPSITDNSKDEEYTKVTFEPDFERFGMSGIDDELEGPLDQTSLR